MIPKVQRWEVRASNSKKCSGVVSSNPESLEMLCFSMYQQVTSIYSETFNAAKMHNPFEANIFLWVNRKNTWSKYFFRVIYWNKVKQYPEIKKWDKVFKNGRNKVKQYPEISKWDKVLKNGPSKIYGKQPLKIWRDMVCLSLQFF